ncbi:MAG: hypothetical protein U9R74_13745 [Pseudomonadota bacterium]|nr:hypothetical protein [Pseudomonadota bacterium]
MHRYPAARYSEDIDVVLSKAGNPGLRTAGDTPISTRSGS